MLSIRFWRLREQTRFSGGLNGASGAFQSLPYFVVFLSWTCMKNDYDWWGTRSIETVLFVLLYNAASPSSYYTRASPIPRLKSAMQAPSRSRKQRKPHPIFAHKKITAAFYGQKSFTPWRCPSCLVSIASTSRMPLVRFVLFGTLRQLIQLQVWREGRPTAVPYQRQHQLLAFFSVAISLCQQSNPTVPASSYSSFRFEERELWRLSSTEASLSSCGLCVASCPWLKRA